MERGPPPGGGGPTKEVGEEIPDEHLDHLSPLGREHITLTGTYLPDLMATSTLEILLNDHPQ